MLFERTSVFSKGFKSKECRGEVFRSVLKKSFRLSWLNWTT